MLRIIRACVCCILKEGVLSCCWLVGVSVYNKTLEYVKTFAKFNTTDSASAVRECVAFALLHATRTHGFF